MCGTGKALAYRFLLGNVGEIHFGTHGRRWDNIKMVSNEKEGECGTD